MTQGIEQFSIKATEAQDAVHKAALEIATKLGLEVHVSTVKAEKSSIEVICRFTVKGDK